jgi:hypothetical protein
MTNLAGIVQQLQKERDQAARVVERLDVALAALNGGSYGRRTGHRRHLSAAGRARIAAAPRARWAKVRGNAGQKPNVVSTPKKNRMSAGRGLPQHNGHGGRSSGQRRRRLEETQTPPLGSGIGGVISCLASWKCIEEAHCILLIAESPQWFCSMSFQPPLPSLISIRVTGWTSHTVALWVPISDMC